MKNKQRTIWDELEQGFGGGSKFRVLLQLLLNPNETFTKYALVKATGMRTPSVESQLKLLLELGWVKEYAFTPKTYQINLENEVVSQISDLFQKIRHIKGST
jgi:DNA-binding IclR family transcriptional regulator